MAPLVLIYFLIFSNIVAGLSVSSGHRAGVSFRLSLRQHAISAQMLPSGVVQGTRFRSRSDPPTNKYESIRKSPPCLSPEGSSASGYTALEQRY
jgi:hypothetical protein